LLAIFEISFVPHKGWERYFITASPAWYALVAAGFNVLAEGLPVRAISGIRRPATWPVLPSLVVRSAKSQRIPPLSSSAGEGPGLRPVGVGVAALAGLVLLAGMALSLHNYYFDPAYWRNDLRSAERPVEAFATKDAAVIVNGPPQFPSFFYYFRGTIPWFELPASHATASGL
jgi:hypothetical protein